MDFQLSQMLQDLCTRCKFPARMIEYLPMRVASIRYGANDRARTRPTGS